MNVKIVWGIKDGYVKCSLSNFYKKYIKKLVLIKIKRGKNESWKITNRKR